MSQTDYDQELATKEVRRFQYRGKEVAFCIAHPDDYVQRIQNSGTFYELFQLERLGHLVPHGGVVLDIGSNVGNHAIYFARFTNARAVVAFEPNPALAAVLRRNMALNAAYKLDLSKLDVAIGSHEHEARIHVPDLTNWGNGRLIGDGASDRTGFVATVRVRPLDAYTFDRVDLIKIDVEGHEIQALQGARKTIEQHRPVVFIEMSIATRHDVSQVFKALDYQVIDCFIDYEGVYNYLYVPVS